MVPQKANAICPEREAKLNKEDNLQDECAVASESEYIITGNIKDFNILQVCNIINRVLL